MSRKSRRDISLLSVEGTFLRRITQTEATDLIQRGAVGRNADGSVRFVSQRNDADVIEAYSIWGAYRERGHDPCSDNSHRNTLAAGVRLVQQMNRYKEKR
jgi:hypothetical protein